MLFRSDSSHTIADIKRFERGGRIQTRSLIYLGASLAVGFGGFALYVANLYQDNAGSYVGAALYFSGIAGVLIVVLAMLIKGAYVKHRARTHPPSVTIRINPLQAHFALNF